MDISKHIGAFVIQHRTVHNMTQVEFSKKSGICRATLAKIERGYTGITVATLEKILKATNRRLFSLEIFIEGEENNSTTPSQLGSEDSIE